MTKEQIKKAKSQYKAQKSGAKLRNIDWQLTFDQWINWWLATGNYANRGCKKGQYCMCRYGDVGAYALDNIYCDLVSNNISGAHSGKAKTPWNKGKKMAPEQYRQNYKHSEETKEKMAAIKLEKPTKYWSGKTRDEESKQKMSLKRKEWWANKKAQLI